MAMDAFDLAERFQTLDLRHERPRSGDEHLDVHDRSSIPSKPVDRGKVLDAATLARLGTWGRYEDVDGDGIPYRTIPGNDMPAYFTRGSGHNAKGQYSERPDDYVNNMDRLARKFETARQHVPRPVVVHTDGRGDRHHRVRDEPLGHRREPRAAGAGVGMRTGYLRLRAYPFTEELDAFIDRYARVYVVEQNRDAQMLALMRLELAARTERQAAERAALQRPADRRAFGDRCDRGAGRAEGKPAGGGRSCPRHDR